MKVVRPAEGEPTPEARRPRDVQVSQQAAKGIPAWEEQPASEHQGIEEVERTDEVSATEPVPGESWRERALRLQAEMENYRKRQRRLAEEQIDVERERLLRAFLPIVDNLERALAASVSDCEALREGVHLTHKTALQVLGREGAEPIQVYNRTFDPNWHEAVATVRHNGTDIAPYMVVQSVESGYRLGKKLLRPAKVVVAV